MGRRSDDTHQVPPWRCSKSATNLRTVDSSDHFDFMSTVDAYFKVLCTLKYALLVLQGLWA